MLPEIAPHQIPTTSRAAPMATSWSSLASVPLIGGIDTGTPSVIAISAMSFSASRSLRHGISGVAQGWLRGCLLGHWDTPNPRIRRLEIWKSSGCADCDGAFADGDKARDQAPT